MHGATIKIVQQMLEVKMGLPLRPVVKYGFHHIDFSQSLVISLFSTPDECYPNLLQKCVKLGNI